MKCAIARLTIELNVFLNEVFCIIFCQQVQDILEREEKEIGAQILNEIDTTEIVFMEEALKILQFKKEKDRISFEEPEIKPAPKDDVPIIYEKQEVNGNKIDWFDVDEEGAAAVGIVQNQLGDLNIHSNLNPYAPEFNQNVDPYDENIAEEFPLTEIESSETEILDNSLTDIDKQNQAKYFYFYQGKIYKTCFVCKIIHHNLVYSRCPVGHVPIKWDMEFNKIIKSYARRPPCVKV